MTSAPRPRPRTLKPELESLKNGRWRLLWFGGLRPATDCPASYEAKTYFEWAGSGHRDLETCWLPLTLLPILRAQSTWENRVFSGFGEGEVREFQVRSDLAEIRPPWTPGQPRKDLLKTDEYRFHGIRDLAPCWTFFTTSPDQLVVPAWEVLRAWYLFDAAVIPAVLAGLRHAHTLPSGLRPYLDGTGTGPDGRHQFVAPQWINDTQARRVARLLFDPTASSRSYGIYGHLMKSSGHSGSQETNVSWPAILPPYDGVATWQVSCRRIASPPKTALRRWLVLNLLGAELPATLPEVTVVRENDNRQGANRDDPNLPVIRRRTQAPVTPGMRDSLLVTGGAPDGSIEPVSLAGFGFRDSIDRTLQLRFNEKPFQVCKGEYAPAGPVNVDGGATDPAGRKRDGYARVVVENDADDALPAIDLLRRTVEAFQAFIRSSYATPASAPDWSAQLLADGAPETVRIFPKRKCKVRHFAVLELRVGDRYAYALDAQRAGSERFRIMLCRSRDYLRCGTYIFQSWLSDFPATSGCPWTGRGIAPRVLAYKGLNHQPAREDLSPQQVTAQLADRLRREMIAFVGHQ